MRSARTIILIAALMMAPWQTSLASEALQELLIILKQRGSISEAEYKSIKALVNAEERARDEEAEPELKIDTKGGVEVTTYDGEFSFELGGRLMIDSANYNGATNQLGNGTALRRARLEAEGVMFGDWGYEFSIDFADKDADIKDAYLSYEGWHPLKFQFGQLKEPFSLEEMTSSRYITFMERALPNELTPGRHIGVGARYYSSNWTLAGGVFGEGFDDDVSNEGDEGWGASGRVTYSPWHDDTQALHLGGALAYRKINDKQEIQYDARPESDITDVKFLNTDDIEESDSILVSGLEAAWVFGPWSLQGEYMRSDVRRFVGNPDLSFDGWYLYGSWFITGESRDYKFKKGAFGRVRPNSKSGAWELALRYSTLDLNDDSIHGGEAKHWTAGLNWYINPNMRLMTNYILVDNDIDADDDGDVTGDDDLGIFQLRLQADF
jgi:phosphate-selective porin OprO/OprP